ncbi:PQQ-binding-like beta-propeller repeat protein [Halohasta litorea]|uniref:PQQ-binding-like beta-propeller repeat protein n=1 Tax=Halohasta litorea TaxID=869891 RepID=A0ABD6D2P1_9EURY|nr:PQQ-binding-like beta-propeller repeat protein [Halohasta litorea]
MNRSRIGCRLSRRSTLALMMAGGIGCLSASRVRASDEPLWPVHGVVYAVDLRDGSERWRTETDSVYGQPIVTDEAVYTASHTSVRALDRERGRTQWELGGGMPRRRSSASTQPGITETDERVYVNTGTLFAVTFDGSVEWEFDLDDYNFVTPTVAEGVVVACRNDRPERYELIGLDAETGRVEWSVERDSDIDTQPAVTDGIVSIDDPSADTVDAYDLETGEKREPPTAAETSETNTSQSSSDGLEVARRDDVIEAVENEDVVWSFEARDIKQIDYDERELRERTWRVHEPVVDGDTVFIGAVQLDRASVPRSEVRETGSDGSLLRVGMVVTTIAGIGVLGRRVRSSTDE